MPTLNPDGFEESTLGFITTGIPSFIAGLGSRQMILWKDRQLRSFQIIFYYLLQLEAPIERQLGGSQPQLPQLDGYQAELERQFRSEEK